MTSLLTSYVCFSSPEMYLHNSNILLLLDSTRHHLKKSTDAILISNVELVNFPFKRRSDLIYMVYSEFFNEFLEYQISWSLTLFLPCRVKWLTIEVCFTVMVQFWCQLLWISWRFAAMVFSYIYIIFTNKRSGLFFLFDDDVGYDCDVFFLFPLVWNNLPSIVLFFVFLPCSHRNCSTSPLQQNLLLECHSRYAQSSTLSHGHIMLNFLWGDLI